MRLLLWRAIQLLTILAIGGGLLLYVVRNPARCAPSCMRANLARSTLNDANLSSVNLVEAHLSNTILERATLRGADLSGAIATDVNLVNANLDQTILVGTNLAGSDLRGASLAGADLRGTNLSAANLTQVDLTQVASLRGVLFVRAKMVEVQLAGANLSGVDLSGANLTSANLEGANLSGAYLSRATLQGANLKNADLSGAWFNLADLTGADLTGARLAGSSLIGSTLASASFSQANLTGTNAVGANFDGADLRSANLRGVRFLASEISDLDIQLDPELAALNKLHISQIIQNARLKGSRFNADTIWSPENHAVIEGLLGVQLPRIEQANPQNVGGVELPVIDPARYRGAIAIAGSASIYPITQNIADQFIAAGYKGTITISNTSTGAGFEQFCTKGTIEIVNASRVISEEEIATCDGNGRTPLELRIGTDALVVVVHPSNDFITDATIEDLARIFTANSWSDINPRWPRKPIQRFVLASGSGARTFFESVIGLSESAISEASNTVISQDNDKLVESLAGAPLGIAFLNYAAFQKHSQILRAITVDGVAANYQNVEAGRYALTRPLLIYTDPGILQLQPQVTAFVTFYLQNASAAVEQAGFFRTRATILKDSALALQKALTPE